MFCKLVVVVFLELTFPLKRVDSGGDMILPEQIPPSLRYFTVEANNDEAFLTSPINLNETKANGKFGFRK